MSTAAQQPAASPAPASPPLSEKRAPARRFNLRRWIIAGVIAIAMIIALFFGAPIISQMLNTISTDDAYVNGHVTFVAARVPGQVINVLVDNNNRVRKGDILVQLDKEPYRIQLELQKAVLENAKANLTVAQDEVRALIAQARANRYKLQHSIEDVNN